MTRHAEALYRTAQSNAVPRHHPFKTITNSVIYLGSNIGNALQSQADMNWIPGRQIVFNALVDQVDQITIGTDQDRDEQVSNLFLCVFVR